MGIIAADEPTHVEKCSLVDLGRESISRVRRELDELSVEEREQAAGLNAADYKKWREKRKKQRQRAAKAAAELASLPPYDAEQAQAEADQRRASLTAWVNASKSDNKFARSLVALVDQEAVVQAWLARVELTATSSKAPTVCAIADALAKATGRSVNDRQAGRLLNKVQKLELPGGPWSTGK